MLLQVVDCPTHAQQKDEKINTKHFCVLRVIPFQKLLADGIVCECQFS